MSECTEYRDGVCLQLDEDSDCKNPGRKCCGECEHYLNCEHEDRCNDIC